MKPTTHARSWRNRFAAAGALLLAALAGPAGATYISTDERIEAQAEVSMQNTFHHRDSDAIDWVQNRNEIKLGLRYYLVPPSQELGIIKRPRINILYRGRYDSVFDVRDSYRRRGFDRDDMRFPEGEYPRELYLDLDFTGPLDFLSLRIGRQQVVWGEADLFRSLDVINPLRLDQNGLIGERFDDYREPLLIAKFLANLGMVGPIANAGLEFFYSPNSQPLTNHMIVGEAFRLGMDENACMTLLTGQRENPANARFECRRPTSLPFWRTRHPWEVSRVGPYKTDAASMADVGPEPGCRDGVGLNGGCGDFVYGIHDQWPRDWISWDSSMAGARFFGQTFAGIDFSLNYIFKRSEVPGTALAIDDLFDRRISQTGAPNPRADLLAEGAAALVSLDADGNGLPDGVDRQVERCINEEPQIILGSLHGVTPYSGNGILGGDINTFTGCEQIRFWYPWTHILGVTATYNDYDYTGFIWRTEQSFSFKEPRNHTPPLSGHRAGQYPTADDFDTHLKRTTQVWRSMIGFDLLRSVMTNPPRWVRTSPWGTLLRDQWFFTFQFFNEYYSHANDQIGLLDSVTDRQQHWNPVLTYVMTGFFNNNRLRPYLAAGYDVNAKFPIAWLQAEYFVTPKLAIKAGEILYMGSKNAESFLFLNKYADRDTFFVQLSYWLL